MRTRRWAVLLAASRRNDLPSGRVRGLEFEPAEFLGNPDPPLKTRLVPPKDLTENAGPVDPARRRPT